MPGVIRRPRYPATWTPTSYSQEHAVEDLRGLLDHLGVEQAHVGGLSMGGNVALNFGLAYPQMAKSLMVAGAGTGSADPESFRRRLDQLAQNMESGGWRPCRTTPVALHGSSYCARIPKDTKGWQEFAEQFSQHSSIGSAMTFRGVQGRRPPIFELESRLRALDVPTLIMVGDEDDPCIEPGVFMKRCIPSSGLVMFPQAGHAINLEDPDLFNRAVLDFLTAVEAGKWARRDPGVASGSLT